MLGERKAVNLPLVRRYMSTQDNQRHLPPSSEGDSSGRKRLFVIAQIERINKAWKWQTLMALLITKVAANPKRLWLSFRQQPNGTPSPSSKAQEKKVRWKQSWVQVQTGGLLTKYCQRQNRLHLGKIYLTSREQKPQ